MWHQWFNHIFMKLREYFLWAEKTKITLFNNLSSPRHPGVILESITTHMRALIWKWLINYLVFSVHFVKLQLNHWCHMDHFNDVLSFCALIVVVPLLSAGSESSRISSKISWRGHMMRFQVFLSLWSVTSCSCIDKIPEVANTKVSKPKRYSL